MKNDIVVENVDAIEKDTHLDIGGLDIEKDTSVNHESGWSPFFPISSSLMIFNNYAIYDMSLSIC